MSKFSFISDIVDESISPKTKFQLFEVQIGFECAEILVPFSEADTFLEEVQKSGAKSITALEKIAVKFGGKIK